MKSLTRRIIMVAVIIAGVIALTAQPSSAQMGYNAASLEWLVTDSDVVVRGVITNVSREPAQEQRVWVTLTLKMHEILKGQPPESLTFAVNTVVGDERYEQWRDARQEQLWFLVRNEQYDNTHENKQGGTSARYPLRSYGGGWDLIRLGPSVPDEQDFAPVPPPIFTMPLSVLKEPQEILQAARAAVAEGSKSQPVSSYSIQLPRSIMQRSGRSGDVNMLTVPIDHRVEILARRLIKSPEAFLRPELARRPQKAEERRL